MPVGISPKLTAAKQSSCSRPKKLRSRNDDGCDRRSGSFLPPELEFIYAQFLDAKFESGVRKTELPGGAIRSRNPALRGAQGGLNCLALARFDLTAEFLNSRSAGQ